MQQKVFRSDINLLRAISIISVLLYHFEISHSLGGFIGVDIFFVISGFLMTKIILNRYPDINSLKLFYRDRISRIIPALFVLLISCITAGFFLIDPFQLEKFQTEALYAASFLSNFEYFKSVGYFNPTATDNWLLHTWSLSLEWQFYILYPVYIIISWKIFGRRLVPLMILALFVFSLSLAIAHVIKSSNFYFYLLPCRAWEMAAGGLVYFGSITGKSPSQKYLPLKILAACCALFAILASVVFIRQGDYWPSLVTLIPVVAASAFLLTNIDVSGWPLYKPISYIGYWSYSIYLWHWPVLKYIDYINPHPDFILKSLGMAVSALLGFLSYRLVEQRAGRTLKGFRFFNLLGAACLAAALLGGLVAAERALIFSGPSGKIWRSYIEARKDESSAKECLFKSSRPSPCFIQGAAGSVGKTLVIGDSHALMWLPRLQQAKALGLGDIYATAFQGCPVLPGVNTSARPCAEFNRRAFDWANSGNYDRVIFISLWNYFSGDVFLCVEGPTGCTLVTDQKQLSPALAQFASELSALEKKGVDVTITLPPLSANADVPAFLARGRYFGRNMPEIETVRREEQENKRALSKEYIKSLAQYGVRLLDPFDMFCDTVKCSYVDRLGRPYFRDSNHVRSNFIRNSPFLDPALGVRRSTLDRLRPAAEPAQIDSSEPERL